MTITKETCAETARSIAEILANCRFSTTDSSGYFAIRQFNDGTERLVDVYKKDDEKPYYVVYCLYEDNTSELHHTDDLSVEQLTAKLEELYEA